jgi:hypothetical protein
VTSRLLLTRSTQMASAMHDKIKPLADMDAAKWNSGYHSPASQILHAAPRLACGGAT